MATIYFIDFEASSLLPGSFPIEVAWVDEHGIGETYLIKPHPEWLEDDCRGWSFESETVHGISLETLVREGTSVEKVAARAAEVLLAPNVLLYADQPGWDGLWLDTLLEFGGTSSRVKVLDVVQLYAAACQPLRDTLPPLETVDRSKIEQHVSTLAREFIARAVEEEQHRPRTGHRALQDADSLRRIFNAVSARVAAWLASSSDPAR